MIAETSENIQTLIKLAPLIPTANAEQRRHLKLLIRKARKEMKRLEKTVERPGRRLLDIFELAEYINVAEQHIRNKLTAGTFPLKPLKPFGNKLLWDKKDVDEYIRKKKSRT